MSGSRNDETIAPPPGTMRDNEIPVDIDVGAQVVSRLLDEKLAPFLKTVTEAMNAVLENTEVHRRLLEEVEEIKLRQKVNRLDIDTLLDHAGLKESVAEH